MNTIFVCFRFSLPVSLVHTIWDFFLSNLNPYIIYCICFVSFCFRSMCLTGKMFSVGFTYLIRHVLPAKTWSSEYISNTKEALVTTVHLHWSKNLSSQSDWEHCFNASFQQWHTVCGFSQSPNSPSSSSSVSSM